MKITFHKLFMLGLLLAAIRPGALSAQEYFSTLGAPSSLNTIQPLARPTSQATADTNNAAERIDSYTPGLPQTPTGDDKYNMAIGPVHLGLAAGVGIGYNDNINLAPSNGNKASGWFFAPSVTLDASYRLSEMNTLHFSLGASYLNYPNNSEFDTRGILLSPNSELAFTFFVGHVGITVRDRFSYQDDPFVSPTLTTTSGNNYGRFENLAGIQADWAVNEYFNLSGGFDHYNLWTFDNTYNSLARSINTVYIKPSYQITPSIAVGLDASAAFVTFQENVQNDGNSYLVGPFINATVSENTNVYAEVGYQDFTFKHNGTINDQSDSSSWYARVSIANRLSEAFSQRLTFSKLAEAGYGTNFYDLYNLEYAADWKIMQNLTLDPSLFYQHYQTSTPDFQTRETGNRYGAAIGLRYVLTASLTLGLDYRYIYNNANQANQDYRQNLILFSVFYNF